MLKAQSSMEKQRGDPNGSSEGTEVKGRL
jgi:hypothetical protein